jgi:hypothetical protein
MRMHLAAYMAGGITTRELKVVFEAEINQAKPYRQHIAESYKLFC